MTTLLRPRLQPTQPGPTTIAAPANVTERWTAQEVRAPDSWLERAKRKHRRNPPTWTVRARRWDPPASGSTRAGGAVGARAAVDGAAGTEAGAAQVGTEHPARHVPVVLVHGLVVASSLCTPLARHLATDGVVYAPDLPGFGRSDRPRPPLQVPELADALAEWIRRQVGTAAVLVGVSLGTQIALHAARRHPSSAVGLVMASPTFEPEVRRLRKALPQWQREQATQSWALRARQARDYARAGPRRAIATVRAGMADAPEQHIDEVPVPALVVRGGRDPLVSPEWARELAHYARADLALVPQGMHAMTYENPLELGRVVNGFIDRLADRHGTDLQRRGGTDLQRRGGTDLQRRGGTDPQRPHADRPRHERTADRSRSGGREGQVEERGGR